MLFESPALGACVSLRVRSRPLVSGSVVEVGDAVYGLDEVSVDDADDVGVVVDDIPRSKLAVDHDCAWGEFVAAVEPLAGCGLVVLEGVVQHRDDAPELGESFGCVEQLRSGPHEGVAGEVRQDFAVVVVHAKEAGCVVEADVFEMFEEVPDPLGSGADWSADGVVNADRLVECSAGQGNGLVGHGWLVFSAWRAVQGLHQEIWG